MVNYRISVLSASDNVVFNIEGKIIRGIVTDTEPSKIYISVNKNTNYIFGEHEVKLFRVRKDIFLK